MVLGKNGQDGLDPARLTLDTSKHLVKAAYQAERYLFDLYELKDLTKVRNLLKDIRKSRKINFMDKKNRYMPERKKYPITYFDDIEPKKESKGLRKIFRSRFDD